VQSLKFTNYLHNYDDNASIQQGKEQRQRAFFFLSDYMYGGCLTFTVHLLHSLGRKLVFKISKNHEKRTRDFGYAIEYQNVPLTVFGAIKNPFITDMYRHFERLRKLKRKVVAIVIHDPGEISHYLSALL
jgi:hypothetical protein